ncbi:MAG: response regulator [Myxococcota bacterium]|nr:response regulator [Myxococcota bacterium]
MSPAAIRVLLVEDDEEDYLLTRRLLKDTAGASFDVAWVRGYETAMEVLREQHDVWLVDYRLGTHTGLELIGAAIAGGFLGPMILLTGRGDHRVDVEAMKAGASDYLVKDQLSSQLIERVIRHSIERVAARHAQQQAEVALRKSEEQYRQIVEATSDGIIKTSLDARITFVNRRFAELLGHQPHEMVGSSVFDFMSAAGRVNAERAFEDRRRGMQSATDSTFRHRNGEDIWCNIAGTPLLDAEGTHVGNLAVVRDETERRLLQSQLLVSDRMATVGTLAAGVAHEINNPLAAVIANLEFIADTVGALPGAPTFKADITEPLEDAREAAHRVRFIVRDLKLFSRSPTEEPKGPVDVKAIMESSLRMAWNEIRHRARLVKVYGPTPGVHANEARLGQVFLNLLVNAAQALPEGRAQDNEIRVTTRLEGEFVVVEVSDTGPGIAPEIMTHIFDAFFTTKAVGIGTGLGLAICQRLVTDLRGTLTVASELGKGSTFRITIPVASTEARPAPKVVTVDPAAGRRGRIMVIDDEVLVLRGVVRVLSKQHDVVPIVIAREALALCSAGERFDLILCDLMMPDMTGMQLHHELSLVAPEQADRMIFLTGGAFSAEARRFLSEDPKEHLEKPFEPANLRAIVQRYLR